MLEYAKMYDWPQLTNTPTTESFMCKSETFSQ